MRTILRALCLLVLPATALAWSPPAAELVTNTVGAGSCDPSTHDHPEEEPWATAHPTNGGSENWTGSGKHLACAVPLGPALVTADELAYVRVLLMPGRNRGAVTAMLCFTDLEQGYSECGALETVHPDGTSQPQAVTLAPPELWAGSELTAASIYVTLPAPELAANTLPAVRGYSVFRLL